MLATETVTTVTPGLSVDLAPQHPRRLELSNPVMIASGTFGYDGYGRGLTPELDLSCLGAVIPKTVTRWPREGNPEPRWYPESYRVAREQGEPVMLNAIGLTNPGIEAALSDLAPPMGAGGRHCAVEYVRRQRGAVRGNGKDDPGGSRFCRH